jgi:soluble lytic murein transglycosylase-like protein
MTINIRDSIFLNGVSPVRGHTSGSTATAGQPKGAFSGQLDRALESGAQTSLSTPARAQALAETLKLQMLHSSLSLAGENSTENAQASMPFNFQSQHLKALVNAYNASQPEEQIQNPPSGAQPSQLKELGAPTGTASIGASAGPHALDPIIAKASNRYGVDAGLIKAVIKAESNFNSNAVSHAGAQGLMQLMPGTARSLGVSDSFDPEQNVMAGTRFLSDLLKRYNGDLDSALAAYNWGPGNVDKRPDRLPRETRDYLVRVKQLYSSYTA